MPETIAIGHWIHFLKKIALYFGMLATSIGLDRKDYFQELLLCPSSVAPAAVLKFNRLHARPPLMIPPFHHDHYVLLPLKRSIYFP